MTEEAKAILTLIRANPGSSDEWLCGSIDSVLDECQQEAMAQERMACEETHDTEAARFRAELDEAREHSDEQHEGLRQAIAEMDALRRRVAALSGAVWEIGDLAGHKPGENEETLAKAMADITTVARQALAAPAPEAGEMGQEAGVPHTPPVSGVAPPPAPADEAREPCATCLGAGAVMGVVDDEPHSVPCPACAVSP